MGSVYWKPVIGTHTIFPEIQVPTMAPKTPDPKLDRRVCSFGMLRTQRPKPHVELRILA